MVTCITKNNYYKNQQVQRYMFWVVLDSVSCKIKYWAHKILQYVVNVLNKSCV